MNSLPVSCLMPSSDVRAYSELVKQQCTGLVGNDPVKEQHAR